MTTSQTAVEDRVSARLAAELGCPRELLAPDAELALLPGLDSIKLLSVVAEVEQDYGISLDDELLVGMSTVADLVEVVYAAMGGGEQ